MKNVFRIALLVLILLSITLTPITDLNAERFSPWTIERLIGKEAPGFTVKDLSGKSISLSSFKGKPILLNFWATWCPYCRKERPYLNFIYEEYKDKGLVIIAVSTDRSPQKVKAYLKKISMDFVILHDNNKEAAESYGVYVLPTSFLIDRRGIIKHKFIGLRNWTASGSKKLIEELLK
jgi:DsbE subfamily thiol:disulfide oxidoreductase